MGSLQEATPQRRNNSSSPKSLQLPTTPQVGVRPHEPLSYPSCGINRLGFVPVTAAAVSPCVYQPYHVIASFPSSGSYILSPPSPAMAPNTCGGHGLGIICGVSSAVCLKQHSDLLALPQDLVDRCQQSVREHCTFSHRLSELQQWVTMVTQTLETHQGDVHLWDAESQETGPEVRCWVLLSPAFPSSILGDLHTGVQYLTCVYMSIHVSHRGCWLKFQRERSSCPCSKHWASL